MCIILFYIQESVTWCPRFGEFISTKIGL